MELPQTLPRPIERRRRWRRWSAFAVTALVAGLAVSGGVAGCLFATPGYRGPKSDHFDGTRFHNQQETAHGGFGDFLRWQWTRQRGAWSDQAAATPGPPPPRRVGRGDLRVTFINHATVLIQMDGLNILTDPIWSERCSPVSWAGPRRHRPPGIRFEDLPPIDVVLISHNHYDHLDVPTLRRLGQAHHPRFVTGLGNSALLASNGIASSTDLDWWQGVALAPEVRVTAVPAQHFSLRGLGDRDRNLWAGFVLTGPAGTVYFAGDTGFGPHFRQIRERFGPVRMAVLPIGAYRPEWFMSGVHVSPDQALDAHRTLDAGTSVAVHFGTFALADDAEDDPPRRLRALLASEPDKEHAPRFWILGFGEGRNVP